MLAKSVPFDRNTDEIASRDHDLALYRNSYLRPPLGSMTVVALLSGGSEFASAMPSEQGHARPPSCNPFEEGANLMALARVLFVA